MPVDAPALPVIAAPAPAPRAPNPTAAAVLATSAVVFTVACPADAVAVKPSAPIEIELATIWTNTHGNADAKNMPTIAT
ncbi:hypothetical protein EJ419_05530 [Alloscardovia theropitheci]|uniref:Uncharacterized protein n=1 Tax=Alloscardovia theropitheci TaxID=2496842 RepID=A0A4R0QPG6_9BIFI|nr:hypothetical protein EJ419_05530 [Alloscardovia theropitheci]